MTDVVHDTRVERRRSGSGIGVLIAFLIGGILIGALAVLMMNVHGTISWPAGRLDFNLPSIPAAAPANVTAANTLPAGTTTNTAVVAQPNATTTITTTTANPPPADNAGAPATTAPSTDAPAAQPDAQTPDAASP